jgi:hypothetical protein
MYRESFEGGLTPKLWLDPTVIGTPFNVCSGMNVVASVGDKYRASPTRVPQIPIPQQPP